MGVQGEQRGNLGVAWSSSLSGWPGPVAPTGCADCSLPSAQRPNPSISTPMLQLLLGVLPTPLLSGDSVCVCVCVCVCVYRGNELLILMTLQVTPLNFHLSSPPWVLVSPSIRWCVSMLWHSRSPVRLRMVLILPLHTVCASPYGSCDCYSDRLDSRHMGYLPISSAQETGWLWIFLVPWALETSWVLGGLFSAFIAAIFFACFILICFTLRKRRSWSVLALHPRYGLWSRWEVLV